jgi:hypothetical protein
VTHKSTALASPVRMMVVMMIIALLIQFLLGMYTNLFIALPRVTVQGSGALMPGMGRMMSVGFSDPVFMVHMIVGMLLALGAIATVIVAVSLKQTPFMIITVIGLISVLIAGYGGLTFFMNGQHNSASYTMAVGWLSAFTTYFMALRASAG